MNTIRVGSKCTLRKDITSNVRNILRDEYKIANGIIYTVSKVIIDNYTGIVTHVNIVEAKRDHPVGLSTRFFDFTEDEDYIKGILENLGILENKYGKV